MSESFSRSLLKPGGGLTSSGIGKNSSKGQSGFRSVELQREDLEDAQRSEALPVFLRWKEYIRHRREAWEMLADDFHTLQTRYEQLQREKEMLEKKERLGDIVAGWRRAVQPAKPQDWKRTGKVLCWTVLRHWHSFANHRKQIRVVYETITRQRSDTAKKRAWKAYRSRVTQTQGLRRYIRHYQISTLSRWAFGQLKDHMRFSNRQISAVRSLQLRIAARQMHRVLQGWKETHRIKHKGVKIITRLAQRGDDRKLATSLQLWRRPYLQALRLKRVLTALRRCALAESLDKLNRNCLRASVAFLSEELKELPSQLELDFYESCEERIQQLRSDLEHDKSKFQQERESLLARQQRLQSAVSSQASRIYQDLSLAQPESA